MKLVNKGETKILLKKIGLLVTYSILMIILVSCSKEDSSRIIEDNISANQIYKTNLTQDQKDILNLVGVKNDIDIFNYEIDDGFSTLTIWLEEYKNGELELIRNKMVSNLFDSSEGQIAIKVDKTSNYNWVISHKVTGSISSSVFVTDSPFETNGQFSVSSGAMNEPVELETDKEVVLKTFLFEDGKGVSIYNNQTYIEDPKVLKEYDYVYLLKCKFSDKVQ